MTGLYFLAPTFFTIICSFMIVRAAAIALMMTGLDKDRAKFQALSAFSGTGFTTHEAESVMKHPLRRKIVSWLMVLGNAGIVTVIVSSTSSLVSSKGSDIAVNGLLLVAGVLIIYNLATRSRLISTWEAFVEKRLMKSRAFEEGDTEDLLHFIEGYGLVKVMVGEDSFLLDRSLNEFHLPQQGLLVLGIERERKWVPVPHATEKIMAGDRLIVYGALTVVNEIFRREDN